jgi:hypothetical protein
VGWGPPQTHGMTSPENDPQDDRDPGPLGSAVAEPAADDDSMAGPVYPPEETEPDAG